MSPSMLRCFCSFAPFESELVFGKVLDRVGVREREKERRERQRKRGERWRERERERERERG